MSNYIDKLEFHNLLKEYKEYDAVINDEENIYSTEYIAKCQHKKNKVYNKIGERFLLLARNYLNKPFFINYSESWKDDMVSEAVYDMVRYIDNYDVDKMENLYISENKIPEPFSYFTQYVHHGIMRFLNEKKKDRDVLVRLPFLENIDKRDSQYE